MKPQDVVLTVQDPFIDRFCDDCSPGVAVGKTNAAGIMRQGSDLENVISVDNGALRIQPLLRPGWGRSGIAYGPHRRENGLAFSTLILNGHNTSQMGDLGQSLIRRIGRWAKASETQSVVGRLLRWLVKGNKRMLVRQVQRWVWLNKYASDGQNKLDENMAVGWFASPVPTDPLRDGHALIMHAAGPENGELWAVSDDKPLRLFDGVQNVPIYFVIVLRERGAAYYATSLLGTRGFNGTHQMRPLAIDPSHAGEFVYAGLYQSVLGQIGFRVDTRVYSTQVCQLSTLAKWYGTAHGADDLNGQQSLNDAEAEEGGAWTVYRGSFVRTPEGTRARDRDSLAILDPGAPSGLIHLLIHSVAEQDSASVIWRFKNESNYWCLDLGQRAATLTAMVDGRLVKFATATGEFVLPGQANSVQILDDGETVGIYLNSDLLFNRQIIDTRLANATGIGLQARMTTDDGPAFSHFEAHPRTVAIPAELHLPAPWQERGEVVAVRDDFSGPAGPLAEQKTCTGDLWELKLGDGNFDVTGDGNVRVRASAQHPNPGRTAYTVPWKSSSFAEIAVTMKPPGTARGQGENGRGGLIFWQDPGNYIIINTWLDDYYGGASISSFFHLNGIEELYDAVWTNVGKRVQWGQPYDLRVAFDGSRYLAYVNDEPVLYRSLRDVYPSALRLAINSVGIVANWEWGNDTGTTFSDFIGLRKESTR